MDPADHQLLMETIAKFVGLAEALGLISEDVDEIVHDWAAEQATHVMNDTVDEDEQEDILCEWEKWASHVNNHGLESQVDFLLRYGLATEIAEAFAQLWSEKTHAQRSFP